MLSNKRKLQFALVAVLGTISLVSNPTVALADTEDDGGSQSADGATCGWCSNTCPTGWQFFCTGVMGSGGCGTPAVSCGAASCTGVDHKPYNNTIVCGSN